MPRSANFSVVKETKTAILIRDVGPWDKYLTVTNDAENVVDTLQMVGRLRPGMRLFYYNTDGDLDEITLNKSGDFSGFAPGVDIPQDLIQGGQPR